MELNGTSSVEPNSADRVPQPVWQPPVSVVSTPSMPDECICSTKTVMLGTRNSVFELEAVETSWNSMQLVWTSDHLSKIPECFRLQLEFLMIQNSEVGKVETARKQLQKCLDFGQFETTYNRPAMTNLLPLILWHSTRWGPPKVLSWQLA